MSWSRPPPRDVIMAAAVAAVTIVASFGAYHWHTEHEAGDVHGLDALGIALLVVAAGALAWWRRAPTIVLLVAFGTVIAYNMIGYPVGPAFLPAIVATIGAILWGRRLVAYLVLLAGYLLAVRPGIGATDMMTAVSLAAWLLVLAGVGELIRIRRRVRAAEAGRRAEAARAEADAIRRRDGEQRLRMAQDLHDVLGHQLAVIAVQANVGLGLAGGADERVAGALHAIKDAGNAALADLQYALDSLRSDDAPRHPVPLLSSTDDVDRLREGAAAGRLTLTWQQHGTTRPLPFAVDQAAYRILQESLTNAIRHAGPGTRVEVDIRYGEDDLALRIGDDGTGRSASPGTTGGSGIAGMRERAVALGGRLSAGRTGNGFEVEAWMPLHPHSGREQA
ncbi:MAG TPA: histidine kinase [Micromonosporaceae bacterium]|jgi:signal transduction histidine kinase